MCGKFTSMASWSEAAFFSALEAGEIVASSPDDREVTFRVMNPLPLVVWDQERGERRVIAARWGFPHPLDWRRPQPIHARAETIDSLSVFADAFAGQGQYGGRGLVLVKTFNEAPDSGEQHVFEPEAYASAIAFVWRSFHVGAAAPLIACCMVTVPANQLIASLPTDRMPAIIEPQDWAKWIGEERATAAALKAMLKTKDGLGWTMRREQRARARATVREPSGTLF
jgi:putative SOS response-associated peptidase YedK